MVLDPLCTGAKALGHSWPWEWGHWWISLTAADQGAWISGLGAFAAALAAIGVVLYGRRVAAKERQARARLVAAYLYMPMAQTRAALEVLETSGTRFAGVVAGSASIEVQADAELIASACERTRPRLTAFSIVDAAYLPGDIGERLATGVMETEFLFEAAESSARSYLAADENRNVVAADNHRFKMAHESDGHPSMARHAIEKIDTFLQYCRKNFETDEIK